MAQPQLPIPTVGRIVLYRGSDNVTRPAIVTKTYGPLCLNLTVFGIDSADTEAGPKTSVTHAQPDQEPACFPSWHWMPYQIQTAGMRHPDAPAAASEPIPVNTALSFGGAIAALKAGKKVSRAGWNGKGMWLALQRPDEHSKMRQPYIYMSPVGGALVPWLASQTDMLAEDWCVID